MQLTGNVHSSMPSSPQLIILDGATLKSGRILAERRSSDGYLYGSGDNRLAIYTLFAFIYDVSCD